LRDDKQSKGNGKIKCNGKCKSNGKIKSECGDSSLRSE
jgi:hypothetical protein